MFRIIGKAGDIAKLLDKAIKEGYGNMPAVWSLKLYFERN